MVDVEAVRSALLERRKLLVTTKLTAPNANLPELHEQVDAALGRVSAGTYGTCEICKQPIEADWLHAHPLVRSCASHLAKEKQDKLLNDQRLASAYLGRRDWTGDDFRPDFFKTASSPPSASYVSQDIGGIVVLPTFWKPAPTWVPFRSYSDIPGWSTPLSTCISRASISRPSPIRSMRCKSPASTASNVLGD